MSGSKFPGYPYPNVRGQHPSAPGGRAQAGLAQRTGPRRASHRVPSNHVSQRINNEDYLRRQFRIPPYMKVDLFALPDSGAETKPPIPLDHLAKLAIHCHEQHVCTLQDMYEAVEERYLYFRGNNVDSWKGSIRHMLSLKKVYRNEGGLWWLDFSDGEGDKRQRKRGSRSSSDDDYESPA
ncbi:hypothetical protein BD626DRAFT_628814 [Schizophyllum amplum]|uniref:Fork-head domain-containing protein n=1 Tax=Schizophyllum amplum TaxID=97359 RepID=A0A550CIP2_9AGAR|nr:hypothetical protein BD626DRAFT_628814 [Auriculariopsis ampla]